MSLPAQNSAQQVSAAAGQLIFPFSWRCDDTATVLVWVNNVQVGGSTVALNADQTASPGGTVTLAAAAALGDIVTIERQTAQTQASMEPRPRGQGNSPPPSRPRGSATGFNGAPTSRSGKRRRPPPT